jgi:hypothetical protein
MNLHRGCVKYGHRNGYYGDDGRMVFGDAATPEMNTHSPQHRRHPPQLYLIHAEQDNPNEVSEVVDTLSKPTARKDERLSG